MSDRPTQPGFPIGAARATNRLILTATFCFSVVALAGLWMVADRSQAPGLAGVVFGVSLLLCSLCSYLYNMREASPRRWLLRYFDHSAIFLLIAGTYTPFVIAGIEGPFGLDLLIWVWSLALLGIALKLLLRGRYERCFVVLYLALGWLLLTALEQFIHLNPTHSLVFLAIGGIAYTVGAIIYGRGIGNWTDPVWHGCVLAGSGTHFVAVLLLVPQVPLF
jgi:hemolysin III